MQLTLLLQQLEIIMVIYQVKCLPFLSSQLQLLKLLLVWDYLSYYTRNMVALTLKLSQ